MNSFTFYFNKGMQRTRLLARLTSFITALPSDRDWKVEVTLYRRKRSLEQNAYLWGVVYPTILVDGGEALAGWGATDLHEYFLGEHFGWRTLKAFGRRHVRPNRRSSKLSTLEFSDFIAFIQRRMAEHCIYVPDANEQREAA